MKHTATPIEAWQFDNGDDVFYLRQIVPGRTRTLWFRPVFREDGAIKSGFELIADGERVAELEAQFQIVQAGELQ